MQELSKTIFTAIFQQGVDVARRKQEVLSHFTSNIFADEYYVFYTLVKKYPRLNKLDDDFLILYMSMHEKEFTKARGINFSRFTGGQNASQYEEFASSCLALFRECLNGNVSDDDFYLALEKFKMEYINTASINLLQEGAVIVSDGLKRGGKVLNGFEDMQKYVKIGFSNIDSIINESKQKGIITYGVNDTDDIDEPLKVICNYGVPSLDEALGGITQGEMISILGISKAGKSRFMTYVIHNALMHGVNVVVWSIENGLKGWEGLIRARHFNYLYNKTDGSEGTRRFITDKMITNGKLSGELATREAASWLDLKSNTSYGKLTTIDAPFDLDNLIETLDSAVKQGGAQLVAVDYLQLIGSGTSGYRKSKAERIGDAYQKMLRYLHANRIAGLFPAQFKQSSISGLSSSSTAELANMETRDSGGESYEIIKTPDVNIGLVGSIEEIRQGHVTMISIPSRTSAPFDPIPLTVDFGSCTYVEQQEGI